MKNGGKYGLLLFKFVSSFVGGSSLRESCPGRGEGVSFGVAIVLPGEDEEDGDFLRGDPADMVGPDLADVGSGGASLGI